MIRVILSTRSRTFKTKTGETPRTYYILRWQDSQAQWKHETVGVKGVGGVTKSAAETARWEKEQRLNSGTDLLDRPERCTLEEFKAVHERLAQGENLSGGTITDYRLAANHLIKALGGSVEVARLNSTHVAKFSSYLQLPETGLAIATRVKTLRAARAMFNRAARFKMLARNPFAGVKLAKVQQHAPRIYSLVEQQAMVKVADLWWQAFITTAIESGLRRNELLNLTWPDIDFDQGEIGVNAKRAGAVTIKGIAYQIMPWEAKSHEVRRVPVPKSVLDLLRKMRLKSGGSPYVFISLERLKAIEPLMLVQRDVRVGIDLINNLYRRFVTIQKHAAALLSKGKKNPVDWAMGSMHDMRRTFGTRAARVVPLHVLQKFMGHESPETTARYYLGASQADADNVRKAVSGRGA